MSIISKALQKAQKDRSGDPGAQEKQTKAPFQDLLQKTTGIFQGKQTQGSRIVMIAGALGIVILLVILLFQLLMPRTPAPSKPAVKKVPPAARKSKTAVPEPAAAPSQPAAKAGPPEKITEEPAEESPAEIFPAMKQETPFEPEPRDLPRVSGIMYSATNPQAIINGSMARKGSKVSGFTVTDILPDRVTVKFGEKEYELRVR